MSCKIKKKNRAATKKRYQRLAFCGYNKQKVISQKQQKKQKHLAAFLIAIY